ncbi:MAG: radical SAM protein [Bryobacteraceae bacterium]|nr:MAG: radical SAM protein [Bryobacteraceae bacterium]
MSTALALKAQRAPVLLGKRQAEYRLLPAERMLNRCEAGSLMPFHWTVNPYRGCELGCHYCYARYTHEYLEMDGRAFERLIFVKQFRKDLFERELRAVRAGEWIAIGTATDPYQPAERRFGVARAVLEVLARQAGLRVAVTTKSDLAARDAALLARLAERNELRVNFTMTTLDASLARRLEPGAPTPDLRLRALRTLSAAGIETAVFASPVMPGINDGPGELEHLARAAREAGAKHFGAQMLFLREPARSVFFEALRREFPRLAERYSRLYARGSRVDAALREALELRVARIRQAMDFPGRGPAREAAWGQLGLFDAPAAAPEQRAVFRLREAALETLCQIREWRGGSCSAAPARG